MIEARSITLERRGRAIIADVSVGVQSGGLTAIIGPNGAGKSTLLKVLTGEEKDYFGSVMLDGKDIHSMPLRTLAHHRAVLPQESSVSFPYLVDDVIELGVLPSRCAGEALGRAVESVGISHLLGRWYGSLSGGERQMVQWARVLAQVYSSERRAMAIFLDEPTSALDLAVQHRLMKMAAALAAEHGHAVGVVVHDPWMALRYARWCAVLSKGRLFRFGEASKVITEDTLCSVWGLDAEVLAHPPLLSA